MPWYYYGVHTENGKPYFGSPTTHKWLWKVYDCEIQILEWFEDRQEAERVEIRIIKHFIDDPNCLNEHYGGNYSREGASRGGKKGGVNQPVEVKINNGRKTFIEKTGAFSNVTFETRSKGGKIGSVAQHSQKWQCTETGFISTPCGLSSYQKARGINTQNRVKVTVVDPSFWPTGTTLESPPPMQK